MEEILKIAGLSEKEAKIYLELTKTGPINANIVSKRLGIERTVTYNTLNKLVEKGLVNYVLKERKKLFNAADPENLLKPIKEKEELLSEIIPKIKTLQKIKPEGTVVEQYEGREALKALVNIGMKTKEEILIFGGTGRTYEQLPLQKEHREKEAIEQKLRIRAIFNYEARNHPFTKLPVVSSKYLPKGYENIATTIILGDIVSIHIIREKPIIVIIKDKDMAQGYRNLFEFLWKYAEPKNESMQC